MLRPRRRRSPRDPKEPAPSFSKIAANCAAPTENFAYSPPRVDGSHRPTNLSHPDRPSRMSSQISITYWDAFLAPKLICLDGKHPREDKPINDGQTMEIGRASCRERVSIDV